MGCVESKQQVQQKEQNNPSNRPPYLTNQCHPSIDHQSELYSPSINHDPDHPHDVVVTTNITTSSLKPLPTAKCTYHYDDNDGTIDDQKDDDSISTETSQPAKGSLVLSDTNLFRSRSSIDSGRYSLSLQYELHDDGSSSTQTGSNKASNRDPVETIITTQTTNPQKLEHLFGDKLPIVSIQHFFTDAPTINVNTDETTDTKQTNLDNEEIDTADGFDTKDVPVSSPVPPQNTTPTNKMITNVTSFFKSTPTNLPVIPKSPPMTSISSHDYFKSNQQEQADTFATNPTKLSQHDKVTSFYQQHDDIHRPESFSRLFRNEYDTMTARSSHLSHHVMSPGQHKLTDESNASGSLYGDSSSYNDFAHPFPHFTDTNRPPPNQSSHFSPMQQAINIPLMPAPRPVTAFPGVHDSTGDDDQYGDGVISVSDTDLYHNPKIQITTPKPNNNKNKSSAPTPNWSTESQNGLQNRSPAPRSQIRSPGPLLSTPLPEDRTTSHFFSTQSTPIQPNIDAVDSFHQKYHQQTYHNPNHLPQDQIDQDDQHSLYSQDSTKTDTTSFLQLFDHGKAIHRRNLEMMAEEAVLNPPQNEVVPHPIPLPSDTPIQCSTNDFQMPDNNTVLAPITPTKKASKKNKKDKKSKKNKKQ